MESNPIFMLKKVSATIFLQNNHFVRISKEAKLIKEE